MGRSFSLVTPASLISSVSWCAGTPYSSSSSATRPGNSGSTSVRDDRFTATFSGRLASAHCRPRRNPSLSTVSVSRLSCPVCSATATKSSGATEPWALCSHRARHSTPTSCRLLSVTFGWKTTSTSPFSSARGHQRGGRRQAAQPAGHLRQELVAGGVPERLVDVPKPRHVELDHRHDLARRPY